MAAKGIKWWSGVRYVDYRRKDQIYILSSDGSE
jgi:hypothetical protein